jgi:hypothetical protein
VSTRLSVVGEINRECMQVETLGDPYSMSWAVHLRCRGNGHEGLKHKRECGFRAELDMQMLVCTRGRGPFHYWREPVVDFDQ